MTEYAPGMRTIIRDEEWMVKKIETNSLGNKALYCVGISSLVKDTKKHSFPRVGTRYDLFWPSYWCWKSFL